MANPEHLAILEQGVREWNQWREEHPDVFPDLSVAHMSEAKLIGADLSGANLQHAYLTGADLLGCDLRQSNLRGAALSETRLYRANLREADLTGASVNDANLRYADLSRTQLGGAFLSESRMFGVNLTEAQLSGTKLDGADLGSANLTGANLEEADLTWTNLQGSVLSGADFTGARLAYTNFADVDLSTAKGLDSVDHRAPSSIGIDAIYRSKGKIPKIFLRGCGVPDEFITLVDSMVERPIQYYSCFISHSTNDQEFADRLYADLQAKGVRCWFAPHDIRGGRKIHEQIDEAIRLHDKLLLILSADSMASDWVQTEIAKARKREAQEKRQMLFPVALVPYRAVEDWECFDADRGKDSAREVPEYFIPDFSNWKDHDSYQKAFTKLVADLKAESK